MKLNATRIGNTLHVYDDPSKDFVNRQVEERMKKTGEARHDGNVSEWLEDREIVDTSKEGSDRYIWDKTGNRVKCRRVRIRMENGIRSETFVRFIYKSI